MFTICITIIIVITNCLCHVSLMCLCIRLTCTSCLQFIYCYISLQGQEVVRREKRLPTKVTIRKESTKAPERKFCAPPKYVVTSKHSSEQTELHTCAGSKHQLLLQPEVSMDHQGPDTVRGRGGQTEHDQFEGGVA